jgi:hypothetical protein
MKLMKSRYENENVENYNSNMKMAHFFQFSTLFHIQTSLLIMKMEKISISIISEVEKPIYDNCKNFIMPLHNNSNNCMTFLI